MKCDNCEYPSQVGQYLDQRAYLERDKEDSRLWANAVSKLGELKMPTLREGCSKCDKISEQTKSKLAEIIGD